jgi:hypothetical protein
MYNLVEGEYRFFKEGEVPYFSTQEFHDDREAAPHIEQHGMQRDRLILAGEFVKELCLKYDIKTVTDVCCGDGGLLQHLNPFFKEHDIEAWGYEFQPANIRDAIYKRGVNVTYADVAKEYIDLGQLSIMTECLEHFADPHGMVEKIAEQSDYFVLSSPSGETEHAHYELHTWGWSMPAYQNLVKRVGYNVVRHEEISIFQVMAAVK